MKKQGFVVKLLSLVAFQSRGPGSTGPPPRPPPPPPPATPMILRQDRALKFFHKKTFKAKFKKTFLPKHGGLELSHLTVFLKPPGIA